MRFRQISGFNKRMDDYVNKNSPFQPGAYIGCKKSDGLLNISSSMYKKEEIEDNTVFLFKYQLKNKEYCYEEIQCIENYILFIQIKKPDGKLIKWTKKERLNYYYDLKLHKLEGLLERTGRKINEIKSKKQ